MDAFATNDGDRLLWIAVGVVVAFLIVLALFRFIGTFVAAVFLYYATRPIHRRIDERVARPNLAVALALFVVLVPMALVVGYALFLIAEELAGLVSGGAFSSLEPYLQPYLRLARRGEFRALGEAISQSGGSGTSASGRLQTLGDSIFDVASLVFGVIAKVFLLSAFLFYLLRDGSDVRDWFYESVDHDERIVAFTQAVDEDLEIVFFNNFVLVVLTSIEAAVFYYAMNLLVPGDPIVETPVLLGALIGIGTIIPVVGMKIVYLPYAAVLFVQAATTDTPLWHPLVFLGVSAIVIDTIPDVFIRTYLSARSSIHMGLILLGYVLGSMAFGWYGLFLGPIVVVIFYHFAHTTFPWLATAYLEGDSHW
ncbi:hypothetical protein L593_12420 [Salinarchaeum sp. Harcht-Bsk1]|uniref:AI-2E family transporter n=1 Tax=Salinarchaeum sp. Harcht-Bsk1 TaxID=1333523 RepID=UPI00034245DB|nr:AI-2E family transporter [Salinarchaeum sp. Harcht-Bsk1]AGN02423.1 hypothetical protein L593_12420 [Salinarchaeum sp. Harcht-Bsk1]